MTHDANPARQIVHCDDAPVSAYETEAEAAVRVAAVANGLQPICKIGREIARSALGDLPQEERVAILADMLCTIRGPGGRSALAIARNRITRHLHDLIAEEYDAEVARMGLPDVAGLARSDAATDARALDAGKVGN